MGNVFNQYFSEVGENLQKAILPLNNNELTKFLKLMDKNLSVSSQHTFKFRDITENELKKLIGKAETHKNSGIDGISSHLLKIRFKVLLPQLNHIFNSSLRTGIFPESWKTAEATPLFKT